MFSYTKETEHPTKEAALIEAFRDIENDLAHPVEITDENGDLVYSDEQIGEIYVQSNHEPLAPPTVRARVVNKQDEVRRIGWLNKVKSKLNDALSGKPGYWQ